MLERLRNFLVDTRDRQRVAIGLAKGAATMPARRIDLAAPSTWEASAFSQNGEDGILDVLRGELRARNHYFIEIGSADGLENNSAWLAIAQKCNGLMIEGDALKVASARRALDGLSIGVECRHMFVTRENAGEVVSAALQRDPDVLSIDIDGNDWYVAKALFDAGLRPRIAVVEYNSAFGPTVAKTIEYRSDFARLAAHPTHLYYGVSIMGWRHFFEERGYRFVTVERNGVNGFFIDPAHFERAFIDGIRGLSFAENHFQTRKFCVPHEGQLALLNGAAFVDI
jgi:hypothetical protein